MDFIRSTLSSFPPPPPPLTLEDNIGSGLLLDELDGFGFEGDVETHDTSPSEPIIAPPESQWYHGRLDRHTAEERLRNHGSAGGYLVRESDRKPGSFVLSYFGRSGINHFRITAVCGDFYIGGRKFDSLIDLIGYYTSISDLLKKERLQNPVPPPEPVNVKKMVIAILPYTMMPDTDELSFQTGDIFFVHNELGDGWLWVTAHRTGEQGVIFKDLVEDLDDSIDPNSVFPWFHSNVTKDEAVDMLVKAGPGSFLVRPSDNSPGDYSLFFHINNQIQRFRIEKKGVRYLMGGRTFECLESVINRYRKEQIVEGYALGHPVKKTQGNLEDHYKPTEVKNPEKIYATLQECRDTCGIKKTEVCKKSGYLWKRHDKSKKWKWMFFIIQTDVTDTQLLIFDNPKRTKPKGLVDLGCAYLYPVHDSFFEKPHCFQLVERALPCLATVTYLAANNPEELQEWIAALKPQCVQQMARAPKISRLRELKCLTIVILEAHRLPYKIVPNPLCILSLNQIKVAKTKVKTGYDPVWDEEFTMDDLPPDVSNFKICVINRGKRAKDSEVAELTIDLGSLANGEEKEEWYSLSGITPIGEWGSLRLKIRYINDLIMPLEEYSPLKELLLDPKMEVVRALAEVCHSNRTTMASSLLRVFRHERKEGDLLSSLVEQAIYKEAETTTLFRSDSLTTALMDVYMKSVCVDFLKDAVSDTVNRILETKQSCELNPSKLEPTDDNCANAEFLLVVLDEITDNIFQAYESCPRTVRYICGCLQRAATTKWPNERLVKARVVSGFIFLRLICPALLNPRQFGLVSEPPPHMASRSLIMIAKCLQNLANLVEFGGKEPYMEVVNPFILKNKERMITFLDNISNVRDKPSGAEEENQPGDPARDMGTLHHICKMNYKELVSMSAVQPKIKKLVTVTEMLNKHKQKYREMMRS